MEVYELEKSLLTRYDEFMDVLQWNNKPVPASEIKSQWAYFIELCIEPLGWQALWKIPRVICEEMKIRYPTVVFGMVEQVLFKELKAIFTVTAVEDDDIQLPERQEVLLEDLWVTKQQENTAVNVEKTAECIDQLRFFYKNIWMPWDNDSDDDLDWVKKHLESRLRFYDDLKRNNINKTVALHIRMKLYEARYIQERRDYLEFGINDDDDDNCSSISDTEDKLNEKNISKAQITDLMKLHLRMAMIKSEIELLENPEMRSVYEDMYLNDKQKKFNFHKTKSFKEDGITMEDQHNLKSVENNDEDIDITSIVYFITTLNTVTEQINLLQQIKKLIGDRHSILMLNSLQQALDNFKPNDHIILSPGEHNMKFIEQLFDGNISGLISTRTRTNKTISSDNKITFIKEDNFINNDHAIIKSKDDDIILFLISGDFILRNLIIDCRKVRNGIVIKSGNVQLENCEIIGDSISSTRKGITISGNNSRLLINDCTVRNFGVGLSVIDSVDVIIKQSKIIDCRIGMELLNDEIKLKFEDSSIINSDEFGIWYETNNEKLQSKKMILNDQHEIHEKFKISSLWSTSNCGFENNKKGNIIVWNMNTKFFNEKLWDSIEDDILNLSNISSNSGDNYTTPDTSLGKSAIMVTDDSVIEVE